MPEGSIGKEDAAAVETAGDPGCKIGTAAVAAG